MNIVLRKLKVALLCYCHLSPAVMHGAAERRPSVPELIALPGHKAHQEQEQATGGRQQRRWARWAVQMWTVRQASKQAT